MLVVIGTLLAGGMAVVLVSEVPTLLQPGVEIDGARFTGSIAQGRMLVGFLGWVALLGAAFAGAGVQVLRTGKPDKRLLYLVGGMFVATLVGAWRLSSALG